MVKIEQDKAVIQAMKEFCQKPEGFFLMSGKNGTGKTFCARMTFEFLRGRNPHSEYYFISQADLNHEHTKTFSQWGDVCYMLEKYKKADLLILDDVGTRIPSDSFMDFLYSLVDYRWSKQLPTIITTNLTAREIPVKFSMAFFSRISSGVIIRFDGEDRRLKNAKVINTK